MVNRSQVPEKLVEESGSGKVPTSCELVSGKQVARTFREVRSFNTCFGNKVLKDLTGWLSNCFRCFENQASGKQVRLPGCGTGALKSKIGNWVFGVWSGGGRCQVERKDSFVYSQPHLHKLTQMLFNSPGTNLCNSRLHSVEEVTPNQSSL